MNVCAGITFTFLLAAMVPFLLAEDCFSDDSNATLFRVGFSSGVFTDVNENDAKAAMKVWGQVLLKERGLPVDPEVVLLNGMEEISRALNSKLVDAFALTTVEYWLLEEKMQSSEAIVGLFEGRISEEYVLLVHRESGIERIGDLRGRSIAFHLSSRMSLASAWLETLLIKEGLGRTSQFFGRMTQLNKLPRVILPVFFRQSDACVVTRRGFQTMSELNPQVGGQLKVIASSPELMPGGFFFRGNFSPSIKAKALAEFHKVHMTPAGQQCLTIFQSGTLEVHPISVLNSAFELLAAHKRLSEASSSTKAKTDAPESGQGKSGMRGQ
jgi:phosphonate transport system substrate-binding protein